jgi:hypothetical protein
VKKMERFVEILREVLEFQMEFFSETTKNPFFSYFFATYVNGTKLYC